MRCQRGSTAFGSYCGSIRPGYEDVHEFFHAVSVFFGELASVSWGALASAVAFHIAKMLLRTVAWRNIFPAASHNARVPLTPVPGAYVGGVGVTSIVPGLG